MVYEDALRQNEAIQAAGGEAIAIERSAELGKRLAQYGEDAGTLVVDFKREFRAYQPARRTFDKKKDVKDLKGLPGGEQPTT